MLDQKLVMAHVYGHADFFRTTCTSPTRTARWSTRWPTTRRACAATRSGTGVEAVERFLDACLSVEDLIDPRRRVPPARSGPREVAEDDEPDQAVRRACRPSPTWTATSTRPTYLEEQRKRVERGARSRRGASRPSPERDVLGLPPAARAARELGARRRSASCARRATTSCPQRQTKVMNEGWASYWHSKIMTTARADRRRGDRLRRPPLGHRGHAARPAQPVQARARAVPRHRAALGPRPVRPRVGRLRRHGRARALGPQARARAGEDLRGPPRALRRDVPRRVPDAGVLRRAEAVRLEPRTARRSARSCPTREFDEVKQALLFQFTNGGRPVIELVDANHANRSELLLRAPPRRASTCAWTGPGGAGEPDPAVAPARAPRHRARRQTDPPGPRRNHRLRRTDRVGGQVSNLRVQTPGSTPKWLTMVVDPEPIRRVPLNTAETHAKIRDLTPQERAARSRLGTGARRGDRPAGGLERGHPRVPSVRAVPRPRRRDGLRA